MEIELGESVYEAEVATVTFPNVPYAAIDSVEVGQPVAGMFSAEVDGLDVVVTVADDMNVEVADYDVTLPGKYLTSTSGSDYRQKHVTLRVSVTA